METTKIAGRGARISRIKKNLKWTDGPGIPGLAAILASLILPCESVRADDLVVDDQALSSGFAERLSKMPGEGGFPAAKAKEEVPPATGRQVAPGPAAGAIHVRAGDSVYAACAPAVVVVGSIYRCGKCAEWHRGGFATGWLASPDGLVVTNAHVLDGKDDRRMGVMLRDGTVLRITKVEAVDPAGDLAVIRVDPGGLVLPYLGLAPEAGVGQEVCTISHPKGRFYTFTEGVISRHYRAVKGSNSNRQAEDGGTVKDGENAGTQPKKPDAMEASRVWTSVTAEYAGGSSGGPVLNQRGQVVGMVSSTSSAMIGASKALTTQMVFRDCVSLDSLKRCLGGGE